MRYLILTITLFAIGSCQPTDEHDHSHDEAGMHVHNDAHSVDYTIWTDLTELFVEFPVLTVGEVSRFAAHFTILDGHQPVREGSVTVSLIRDKKGIRHTVEAPSSPGIFAPALLPSEAGMHQLVFDLNTPDYSDRFVIDSIRVFDSQEDAALITGVDDGGDAISFLKEQAWKLEFQTVRVTEKEIFQTIPTSGIWKVSPSDYQTLVAPSSGLVNYSQRNLIEGSRVRRGQVLFSVSSSQLTTNNLSAEIQKARADLDQAEAEYERKKALFESRIVPGADLERAEQRYLITKANYETLTSGFSGGGKQVISPIDGFIRSVQVNNGAYVDQGADLITITNQKNSLLEVRVSPSFSAEIRHVQNLWYQPSPGTWSNLKDTGGKILSVGKEVSTDQPLLSVIVEVNEGVEMPEGSFTEVQLAIGQQQVSRVIPISALLEDYGKYSVIVQLSGESFEQREILTGRQNGSEIEIRKGLKTGEVVVTKGAYQVKMASMSGQVPAHGHTH